jgi:putative transposase
MARLQRISPLGIPQHVIQRGNNRQICFGCERDLACYARLMEEYSRKFSVAIHAWVFMTNHVHLLLTPHEDNGISNMMQAVGRQYVPYFNRKYRRSGTLWEGRFRSSLVQSERYLLQCQRYIELNPVRAGMVSDPADYAWSSYQCHALGKDIRMSTPHDEYLRLGDNRLVRQRAYLALFQTQVGDEMTNDIRKAVNKGLALGDERFKEEIERLHGRRLRPARMGRPWQRNS